MKAFKKCCMCPTNDDLWKDDQEENISSDESTGSD